MRQRLLPSAGIQRERLRGVPTTMRITSGTADGAQPKRYRSEIHPRFPHQVAAVVLQVRAGHLSVLLWKRHRVPQRGAWSLPCGEVDVDEALDVAALRHLAAKVDVHDVSHSEQLKTFGAPGRHPLRRLITTAFLDLVAADLDPALPDDTRWHSVAQLPSSAFDHGEIIAAGLARLRAKLSYTNLGFALTPDVFTISELRRIYSSALGQEVNSTNLQRILERRGQIVATGMRSPAGRTGGRPAEQFRFVRRELVVTDAFAVFRPHE